MLATRIAIHTTLCHHLQKVQASMKLATDVHRRDVQFDVNNWVYVRLRPHHQTSVASTYTKLSKRFFGPFRIQARVGLVAYRINLPQSSKIHQVFHVSLLKRHISPSPAMPDTLS